MVLGTSLYTANMNSHAVQKLQKARADESSQCHWSSDWISVSTRASTTTVMPMAIGPMVRMNQYSGTRRVQDRPDGAW